MSQAFSGSPVKIPPSSEFESKKPSLSEYRGTLKTSMTRLFVGPMPVKQFLDDFLTPKTPLKPCPNFKKELFKSMPKSFANEDELSDELVRQRTFPHLF